MGLYSNIFSRFKFPFIVKTKGRFTIGSLWDNRDRIKAAELVAKGEVIGVFNRGVNALWLDAQNPNALKKLRKIKGEIRQQRPLALTLKLNDFIKLIDLETIPKEIKDFLILSEDLKDSLGSLCFIRVPIKNEYKDKVPKSSLLTDDKGVAWLQSWDPHGHLFTEALIKSIIDEGVEFPGVTSMNITGQPEIVSQTEAVDFCKTQIIPFYLKDPYSNPKLQGSYTIITLSRKGIELTREGNIAGKYIQQIFGLNFIKDGVKEAKYPQIEFPELMFEGLNSKGVRLAILLYLEGNDPSSVNSHLKSMDRYKK